ncbi:MAG: SLC26A/SulP transporter family protein [Mesorhizobium sp.]|nr:cyclic nucleotide-binding domain-containing protein [Mesorhizobium sp.]MBL8578493.1 SLC26A/SulP transporter family protein [Mesorhizobium sp.]
MAFGVAETRSRSWLPAATIGFLAGIDNIAASLAIASLLFAGPLSEGLGVGVGIVLVGGAILALVVALRSALPNSIALVQESSIAILAAAIITATATLTGPADVRVATAVAVLGVSSLATGTMFWITGRLRLGGLARFMPYPVVAGFLAGSGWLLIDGAVVMMTGSGIDLSLIERASQPNIIFIFLPAIAFAVALEIAIGRFRHTITIAVVMALAAIIFFGVLAASGITIEEGRALGYFPQLTANGGIEFPTIEMLMKVDWNAVLMAAPTIIAVAAVSMVGLLLNLSGLELAMRRDIDVNAELRSTGIANLLSGVIGGPSGYVGLTMTILAERTGVYGRGAGIATAIAMIFGLVAAGSFVFEVPVFLAAGFVLFMGIGLLKEWLFATRRELPIGEWLIVLFILACIALIGFLEGLAVGLLVSIAVFVFNYARLPIMRVNGNGVEYRSSVDRSAAAARFLARHGEAIEMIQLQGYLFFGSADGMVKYVQRRLTEPHRIPLRFLVLDFRHVSGLDSAATTGFIKIRRMSEDNAVKVFLTQVPDDVRRTLQLAGIRFDTGGTMTLEADIDHALEHAEEAILEEQSEETQTGLLGHFNALAGPHPRMDDLLAMMSRVEVKVGDSIITAGDKADDLFFIAHGRVRVQVTLANGRKLRLRTMTDGSFVGEIGLYMRQERTADVIVEMPSEIFRLGADDLTRLETDDPELALLAHRLLATNLCEKLAIANQTIKRSER